MILYITDRNIRVDNADNQISYNSDYIAEFHFDDEWNGKVKTARFVQNGEYIDIVLVDDRCDIPPLKTGFVRVGVFTDSMTSTYADVYYKTSIKDGTGNPAEPPEDVYAQLITLIESGILKGEDGLTPYVGENGNWWLGSEDTGILARGTDGYTPVKGVDYFTTEEVQQIQNEVSESIRANINRLEINKADKSDLAKTNLYLDALYKLNREQTYDVLQQESGAYSVDVPSGSHYAGIDMVGGHSEVIDGEIISSQTDRIDVIGKNIYNGNSYRCAISVNRAYVIGGSPITSPHTNINKYNGVGFVCNVKGGKTYALSTDVDGAEDRIFWALYKTMEDARNPDNNIKYGNSKTSTFTTDTDCVLVFMKYANTAQVVNWTYAQVELGSTATEYSPYSLQQITTGFPVLHSAGSVYDYIDLNEGKLYTWTYIEGNEVKALTEPVITDIEIPTELTDWLTVETGGSITFHNTDEGKRLLIPNKLSFIRKLDEVTV